MCEAFGAYGWNEGLKTMKWIADHLLVRGVNYIVPHAFDPKAFPDFDCPPHFYAHGKNPQFRYFPVFTSYVNRIASLFRGGSHPAKVGVFYPAELEWMGTYMPVEKPARVLTEHQISFDIVSLDYLKIYGQSLLIAFVTTVICILIGYPFSWLIARTKSKYKKILYMLVIVPFWTNSLIRVYGWRTFLGTNGWLNTALQFLHLADGPLDFLYNRGTTILGMVYCLLPFMILPLYTSIEKLDQSLLEASADLGAKRAKTFLEVVLPLTSGGIFSGSIMIFIPCLGYFFISDILGGGNSDVIGNLIERQFQSGNNWPLGAALSIVLIVITLILVKLYQRMGGSMESLGV